MDSTRPAPIPPLLPPSIYFPPESGRYTVSPSLLRLGTDFGNGERDAQIFQIDSEFPRFRASGLAARAAHPERHVLREGFDTPLQAAVVSALAERMAQEHPTIFTLIGSDTGNICLRSALTSETLHFDAQGNLTTLPEIPHQDALDALSTQIQEDIAVVQRMPDGSDRIVALNVCAPSRWSPEEKIGSNFDRTHTPVPGMEKIRTAARGLTAAMVERPPTVRFTWGVEFSECLNLHPLAEAANPATRHESADRLVQAHPLFLRVERQVIYGLPNADAALFLIRPHVYDLRRLIRDVPARRDALIAALQSMPAASRIYKGLGPKIFDAVLRWLNAVADIVPAGNTDTQ